MMLKASVKFFNKWYDLQKRIRFMPKIVERLANAKTHADAESMVKTFHDGIKQNSFHLKKLKDGTIQRKRYLGYKEPDIPLYGMGDAKKKNSYMNMLRIKKIKNGFRVFPGKEKHWDSSLTLEALQKIHEHGIIIKRGNSLIRIPPRPAMSYAFKAVHKGRTMKEVLSRMRAVIRMYIRKGDDSGIREFEKEQAKGVKSYA